jgi:hypothetical protein
MVNMQVLHEMLNEQYTEAHFEALLQIVDRLHDAAAAGKLGEVSPMEAREVIGWLDDIIFTAEETLRELQATFNANSQNWPNNLA